MTRLVSPAALRRATAACLTAAVLLSTAALTGCYTQKFDVGTGGTTAQKQEFPQWFILYGLIPLTKIDGQVESYTAGEDNYTVTTQFTPIDCIINFFTGIVTIGHKTVTVEK